MKKTMLVVLLYSCFSVLGEPEAPDASPALSQDTLMLIDDWRIPSGWFRHEFRSTFFRYAGATNVREAVFIPFRNRMILHAKAKSEQIDQDAELQWAIDKRIESMRAFMEYQLDMVRIDMVNDVLVKTLGINTSPDAVTEEEMNEFFEENIKPRPGAPSTIGDVPPHIMESLRAQTAKKLMEQKLEALIREWESGMSIMINEDAIQSVPMPKMEGSIPPGLSPP